MTTDATSVKAALRTQRIETPSWAYGNSGTHFKSVTQLSTCPRPSRR
jgi:L-rhamnose isomerase/sugar isomerase